MPPRCVKALPLFQYQLSPALKFTLVTGWPTAVSARPKRSKKGEQTPCKNKKRRVMAYGPTGRSRDAENSRLAYPAIQATLGPLVPPCNRCQFGGLRTSDTSVASPQPIH